jgi:hypothetical protein
MAFAYRPLQDSELPPDIDDLGFTLRRRATEPSAQGHKESQKTDHPAGSLLDSKGIDRLDKIIGSDSRREDPVLGYDPMGEMIDPTAKQYVYVGANPATLDGEIALPQTAVGGELG